ncbi:MAG: hypothetical protein HY744_00480 [Deltaproteobacteria bacterium]|nr:hypothetical protein [Deltaproteobacteria bacterium]
MNAIQSLIGTISAAPGRIGRPAIFALSALCACAGTEEVAQPLGGCPPEYQGVAGNPEDLVAEIPPSCAFECTTDCPEPETPYDCPALRAWSSFPHAKECGCFDALPPAVTPGTCTASKPGGAALRAAGPQGNGAWVLPDGHLIKPAGVYAPLGEKGLEGTFPMSLLRVPGTSLLLSSDGGILDNALRLLDAEALAAGTPPTAAFVPFAAPRSLFHGLAWRAPATALASGGGDGFVYAFTVDMEKRSVKRDAGLDIDLGGPTGSSYGPARWYSGPLAVSGDGARLLVGPSVSAGHIQMLSLEEESWGEMRGKIAVDAESVFEIALDPFDKQGVTFYATLWDAAELVEIDADAKEVTRTLEVGKNPEGLAFLGPELMVVASADEDRLTVIDRTSWQEKARLELAGEGPLYGHGPTWLAFDAARARLYATLSGVNAVAAFDVAGAGADATIVPAGRIPTAWWPTALSVQDDGSLVVLAGKGTGSGADSGTYSWSEGPITELMHGGVQYVPAWSLLDLAGMTELAEGARQLARTPGYPEVSCAGESYDFPVPRSPADGPS